MNFGSLIIGFIIGCIYTFIVWIVVMVNAENRKEFNRIAEETEIAWKEYKEAKKAQYSFFSHYFHVLLWKRGSKHEK